MFLAGSLLFLLFLPYTIHTIMGASEAKSLTNRKVFLDQKVFADHKVLVDRKVRKLGRR